MSDEPQRINNRLDWFMYGFIFCSIIHLLTGVSPEKAKSNLQAWISAYERGSNDHNH